jgi:hypothetical protein
MATATASKRTYRIVTETGTDAAPIFGPTEAFLPGVVEAAPGQHYIRCDCRKRLRWNDKLVLRVVDEQGEVIFEGCRPCFYARLNKSADMADLQARYERLQALVREVLTPEAWDDAAGLVTRLRAELAIPLTGGSHVH